MRLIDAFTLELREFNARIPGYAILSHTWGDQEVSFQEFTSPNRPLSKKGYTKIVQSCALMEPDRENMDFIWVDTCCIDKSSSAELSESINSMFKWYQNATVCYAYLEDVSANDPSWIEAFRASRWFTRGWTLQELIAPTQVMFFSKEWKFLGSREDLANEISAITSIDASLLRGTQDVSHNALQSRLNRFSVASRMAWAARRNTTRVEDIAYCLMGIFSINMPLLYGEGERAFLRLQEEIVKIHNDQSILAWNPRGPADTLLFSPFAQHPNAFEGGIDVTFSEPSIPMSLDARGLALDLELYDLVPAWWRGPMVWAILQGHHNTDYLLRPLIELEPVPGVEGTFRRQLNSPVYWVSSTKATTDLDDKEVLYAYNPRSKHYGILRFGNLGEMYVDCVQRKRIVLAPSRGRSDMEGMLMSPPLNITSLDDRHSESDRFRMEISIPRPTSEVSIIQNRPDILPVYGEPAESGVYLCLCGALYFEIPYHPGFIVIWGVKAKAGIGGIVDMAKLSWWEDCSPFVSFRRPDDISKGTRLIKPNYNDEEGFRDLIAKWLRNGPRKISWEDDRSSSTLNIGDIMASASVERISFLKRTGYHLTVKVENCTGDVP